MLRGLPYMDPDYAQPAMGPSPQQTGAGSFQQSQGETEAPAPEPKPIGGYPGQNERQADPMAELQRLMGLLEEPQKPVPQPKTWQKVLAAIGDGMVAYSGGQGTAVARVAAPARAAEEENRQISERNAATKRGLIKESWQESQLRERQRLDDQRTSEANDIRARDDTWNELIAREDFQEYIPPGFDIRKSTHADVMDIKAKYWGAKTGDESIGRAIAAYDELNRTRPDLTKGKALNIGINQKGEANLNLSERAAGSGGDTGRKPLTAGQVSAISKELGQNVTGMTDAQINQLRADRAKLRLGWKKLSSTDEGHYTDYSYIVNGVNRLVELMASGSVGGAETLGFATSEEAKEFRALSSNIKDLVLRSRSGAATTPADDAKIDRFTMQLGNLTRNNKAAADELLNFYTHKMGGIELGMPESQVREYRLKMLDEQAGVSDAPDVPSEFVEGS